jgi:hypothetical protein
MYMMVNAKTSLRTMMFVNLLFTVTLYISSQVHGDVTIAGENMYTGRLGSLNREGSYRAIPAVKEDHSFPLSPEGPPHSVAS